MSTYTPAEFEAMLLWFSRRETSWLPFVAIGGFCGLRPSEILRLDWSSVHFTAEALAVPHSIDQVAKEMGNSSAKVRENYNDPKFNADGKKCFNIQSPALRSNIIPVHKAR